MKPNIKPLVAGVYFVLIFFVAVVIGLHLALDLKEYIYAIPVFILGVWLGLGYFGVVTLPQSKDFLRK